MNSRRKMGILPLALICVAIFAGTVMAQTTGFTYQGKLNDGAAAANANYDFEFRLYDAAVGGTQIGSTAVRNGVAVSGGVFAVNLDFGPGFPGADRFLEIALRPAGGGVLTILNPRQRVSSSPYAIKSISSETAGNATTATTANNALQLGGVAADQFVQTGDSRLTDARAPTPGSANYVQNTSVQQAASNFNISGNGTVGGTLAGDTVNAVTQYNINGNRVLSVAGMGNLFAGVGAGGANTSGLANSFFGSSAGLANTTGNTNSFFGTAAGRANTTGRNNSFFGNGTGFVNTTGSLNSFFGQVAGQANTTGEANSFFGNGAGDSNTAGGSNSFFGLRAGQANTTGFGNTIIGANADLGANNLDFATAIGAGAVGNTSNSVTLGRSLDTVQIPGNLNVTGTLTANINGASITNLNASNIATGTLNNARLGIVPLVNGGTGSATKNFVDLTTDQSIDGNKTLSGVLAAQIVSATSHFRIGSNRILGTDGSSTFAGINSGVSTSGDDNAFFGSQSGRLTTTGEGNTFIGKSAGAGNLGGGSNTFIGWTAGFFNSNGIRNTFVGVTTGSANTGGSDNTVLGYAANVGSASLTFATAIGSGSVVSSSNRIVLGRANGSDIVQMPGSVIIESLGTATLTTPLCRNVGNFISSCQSSSLRYKTNIQQLGFGLDLVKRLKPITFDWKEGGDHDLGFGAEDVAAIEPLLAVYGKNGQVEGVKYDRIGVVLVNAVKEQQTQIERQRKQIEQQQFVIDGLRKLVCSKNKRPEICREK